MITNMAVNENNSYDGYIIGSKYEFQFTTLDFDLFCIDFLHLIMKTDKLFILQIDNLIYLSTRYPKIRVSIHYATNSILKKQNIINFISERDDPNNEIRDLYGAVRGFLMLSYVPRYSYNNIANILRKEQHNNRAIYMATGFIGAYFGMNELIKQNIQISQFLQYELNYVKSKEYLKNISIENLRDDIDNMKLEYKKRMVLGFEKIILDKLKKQPFIIEYKIYNQELFQDSGYIYQDITIPIRVISYAKSEDIRDEHAKAIGFSHHYDEWLQPIMNKLPHFNSNEDWDYINSWNCDVDWDDPCKGESEQNLQIWYKPYDLETQFGYGIYPDKENIIIFLKTLDEYILYTYISPSESNLSIKDLLSSDLNILGNILNVSEGVFELDETYTVNQFSKIIQQIIPL
jgi:hypothetical protein